VQAALVEAWEEAGLVGSLDPEPAGAYVYAKFDREHHVLVYRMTVTEARPEWPERHLRQREWLTPDDALGRVEEPGLRDILRRMFGIGGPEELPAPVPG
jgi:8-oxo-dGTP pyrophosphatase MutT (NUDIX family)